MCAVPVYMLSIASTRGEHPLDLSVSILPRLRLKLLCKHSPLLSQGRVGDWAKGMARPKLEGGPLCLVPMHLNGWWPTSCIRTQILNIVEVTLRENWHHSLAIQASCSSDGQKVLLH